MGDRHAAAVSAVRRAGVAAVLVLAGCAASPRAEPALRPVAPEIGTRAELHPDFASFGVVEVAVLRPSGVAPDAFASELREALHAGLLARGYSPLAPDYVDAAGGGVTRDGRTCVVQSAVTAFTRGADGAARVGAWSGLVAPGEDGVGATLYLGEVTDLPLPRRDEDAARLLADALLRRLPPR